MEAAGALFSQRHLWGAVAVSTFVSVGNATQPFNRLLAAVCELAASLPQPVFVQYGAAQDFHCQGCETAAFVDMPVFEQRVAAAELLILHAGAGSVIHAVRAGKVPVVMPRRARLGEHVDDHQLEFARELATTGKVVLCEEAGDLAKAAMQALARQRQLQSTHSEPALLGMVRAVLHGQGSGGG